jgi:hypothetical protein
MTSSFCREIDPVSRESASRAANNDRIVRIERERSICRARVLSWKKRNRLRR